MNIFASTMSTRCFAWAVVPMLLTSGCAGNTSVEPPPSDEESDSGVTETREPWVDARSREQDARDGSAAPGPSTVTDAAVPRDAPRDAPRDGRDGRDDASRAQDSAPRLSDGQARESGRRDSAEGGPPRDSAVVDSDGADGSRQCPHAGKISYTLAKAPNPTTEQQQAYDRITRAMDDAVDNYNCYTDITRSLSVSYVPSVATADGNENGSIRFGSTESMNFITAMHEISHVVGVGGTKFRTLVANGTFQGPLATRELRAITGNASDVVHADSQHFWPYGLNYTSEVKSSDDLVDHCRMVMSIRQDLGM